MEQKIGMRILIREENSRIKINLKPSKNILIGGFQIVMMFAFGYLCYTGIIGMVNNKVDVFSVNNLIMLLFVILTLIGTINRLISFYNIFYSEEEIEVNNKIVTIKRKRLLKDRIVKVSLGEMQNVEIEADPPRKDGNIRIDIVNWTNFILLKERQKIRFFKMVNYNDLEKLKRFLKNKKIIN